MTRPRSRLALVALLAAGAGCSGEIAPGSGGDAGLDGAHPPTPRPDLAVASRDALVADDAGFADDAAGPASDDAAALDDAGPADDAAPPADAAAGSPDLAVGPLDDLAAARDLAVAPGRDLAVAPGHDLAVAPGHDLAVPPGRDLAVAPGHDLASAPDLAVAPRPDLATPPGDMAVAPGGTLFPPSAPWYQDISKAALDAQSAQTIAWLQGAGGWGFGQMKIDFTIEVLQGDVNTPFQNFNPTQDFYVPDCDQAPMPVPPGGNLEGEAGYQCLSGGDCHLIVVHAPTKKLYEMWRADITGGVFNGGCLAVWDLTRVYPASGRGEQCSSADGGGFPITPLLFTADEVAAGKINHAIRFILPNARIQHKVYVHPGTHSTNPTSGGASAPPYGAHFRLRANYPLANLPSDAARTVARAMQTYGMYLADGGNIALTAQDDKYSKAKWANLLGPNDLKALLVTDFEVLDSGAKINYNGNCVRNP